MTGDVAIYKADTTAVLLRPFHDAGSQYLTITLAVGFATEAPPVLLGADQTLAVLRRLHARAGLLDLGLPKLQGEVLIQGSHYPIDPSPAPSGEVAFALGPLEKRVLIFGERTWPDAQSGATAPAPFTEMPITWENAFGGPGFNLNPRGKGFPDPEGSFPRSLPNLEAPAVRIESPRDRPDPIAFDPMGLTWPQRGEQAVGLDNDTICAPLPRLGEDFPWTTLNAAPLDQRIPGFWAGDEAFALLGMHPRRPTLTSALPAIRPRALALRVAEGEVLREEPPLNLDTVWLAPEQESGVCLYRGLLVEPLDDALGTLHLLLALEAAAQPPRPAELYLEALQEALQDPESEGVLETRGALGTTVGVEAPDGLVEALGLGDLAGTAEPVEESPYIRFFRKMGIKPKLWKAYEERYKTLGIPLPPDA